VWPELTVVTVVLTHLVYVRVVAGLFMATPSVLRRASGPTRGRRLDEPGARPQRLKDGAPCRGCHRIALSFQPSQARPSSPGFLSRRAPSSGETELSGSPSPSATVCRRAFTSI
jgi:hypothetical protein